MIPENSEMFFDQDVSPEVNDYNTTLVITKTLYVTATTTVSHVLHATATVTSFATATQQSLTFDSFDVPHHPKADTVFTAIFASICLLFTVGVILRKKSKKLKAFNVPLILGTFCISGPRSF